MSPESRLLRLPPSSRYGMTASVFLASLPDDAYRLVVDIAARTGLSASYLSKILQRLARKGVLDSRRGSKGGYRLIRPAAEVPLSEIVAASSHPDDRPVPCMLEARDCSCHAPCLMHRFAALTEESVRLRLDETTLADLAGSLRSNSGQGESGSIEDAHGS
jgi:Rrf2 family protein